MQSIQHFSDNAFNKLIRNCNMLALLVLLYVIDPLSFPTSASCNVFGSSFLAFIFWECPQKKLELLSYFHIPGRSAAKIFTFLFLNETFCCLQSQNILSKNKTSAVTTPEYQGEKTIYG